MLLSPEQLVQQIHDSPTRLVLAATGGGSRAIADLLETPGGSRTLLEAVVPYSTAALSAWLGGKPDEFCSAAAARAMAMAAFHRARRLEEEEREPVASGQWPVAREEGSRSKVQGSKDAKENVNRILSESLPLATSHWPLVTSSSPQPLAPSPSVPLVGAACSASLASDRPKRGPHRIHVALQTDSVTAAWHLELRKDRRTRAEEERLAGRLLLNAAAEACGVADRLALELLEGERVESTRVEAPAAWQALLLGHVDFIQVQRELGTSGSREDKAEGGGRKAEEAVVSGQWSVASNKAEGGGRRAEETLTTNHSPLATNSNPQSPIPNPSPSPQPLAPSPFSVPPSALRLPTSSSPSVLFPGSFHPLHDGHRRMFQIAQETLQGPVAWEISILNVDKPPLDYIEIEDRIGQFPAEQTVYLSRAATFEEKSHLFAGATFVVGADTLLRIAAPQYYGGNISERDVVLKRIAERGCRFLAFGRDLGDGVTGLDNLDLPDALRALCREVPSAVFQMGVSSSAIRKTGG